MHITQSVDSTTLRLRTTLHPCTASHISVIAVGLKVSPITATHRHMVTAVVTPGMAMASEEIEEFQWDAEFSDETSTERGKVSLS